MDCAKQCAVYCLLHHSKTSPQHTEVINEIKIGIFIREVSCIPTERERERERERGEKTLLSTYISAAE